MEKKKETIPEKILFWFLIISIAFGCAATIEGYRNNNPLLLSEGAFIFAGISLLNGMFNNILIKNKDKKERDRGTR